VIFVGSRLPTIDAFGWINSKTFVKRGLRGLINLPRDNRLDENGRERRYSCTDFWSAHLESSI
jgi:hypothetical protein